mgnify:FL=1|tara:strand:+ start:1463 stop:2107 length:645 start_codon:yes stop_codon:yes gene_type:complete
MNKKEKQDSSQEEKNTKSNEIQDEIKNEEEKNMDENTKKEENTEKEIISSLEEEIKLLKEEKLRLLAEMENLRKRTERDKMDSVKYGSVNLARDILSPNDNLTRALDAIPEAEKKSKTVTNLIDGLKMVQKEFSTILEKHGVKKIESLDKQFDHNYHQAMMEIENDKIEEGIVVNEMQSGYIMHDRLLRPSMVGVSKKSNKDKDFSTDKDKKKP